MSKTLGQVAYEAYYKGGGWEAAAEAVAKHIQKGFILNSPEEDAVIEAAKAFVEANNSVDGDEWSTYHALETAVEALQEVENE